MKTKLLKHPEIQRIIKAVREANKQSREWKAFKSTEKTLPAKGLLERLPIACLHCGSVNDFDIYYDEHYEQFYGHCKNCKTKEYYNLMELKYVRG